MHSRQMTSRNGRGGGGGGRGRIFRPGGRGKMVSHETGGYASVTASAPAAVHHSFIGSGAAGEVHFTLFQLQMAIVSSLIPLATGYFTAEQKRILARQMIAATGATNEPAPVEVSEELAKGDNADINENSDRGDHKSRKSLFPVVPIDLVHQLPIDQQVIIQPPPPVNRRNKGLLCRPLCVTKATACRPSQSTAATQTDPVVDANTVADGLPVPVPLPVPILCPVPVQTLHQPVPVPIPILVPMPVPVLALLETVDQARRVAGSLSSLAASSVEPQVARTESVDATIMGSDGHSITLTQEQLENVRAVVFLVFAICLLALAIT